MKNAFTFAIIILLALFIGCGTTTEIVEKEVTVPGYEYDENLNLDGGVYVELDENVELDIEEGPNMYAEDYLIQIREDYEARIDALIDDCHGSLDIITKEGDELRVSFRKKKAEAGALKDSLENVIGRYTVLKNEWDVYQKTKDRQVRYTDTTKTVQPPKDVSFFEEHGTTALITLLAFGIGIAVGKFI